MYANINQHERSQNIIHRQLVCAKEQGKESDSAQKGENLGTLHFQSHVAERNQGRHEKNYVDKDADEI
jgi:hypothetical protein